MAKLLISKQDFEGRIDLSLNLDAAKKLNHHIQHAQDFDLRGLMGDRFYYFFMSHFDDAAALKDTAESQIKALFEGSDYEIEGVSWNNPGIKPVLVYFAGARLIKGIDQHITPNGFMGKVNEFSEPISNGRRVFQAAEYESQAQSYWNMVHTYMEHNKDLFLQYFGEGCGCTQTRKRTRTIAVGNL